MRWSSWAPEMAASSAQCVNTAKPSCVVYAACFERYCPCERTEFGYFLRYGKKYCDRFLERSDWSEKGKKWRDATLICLQERIVPKLEISARPTCDCRAMKNFAFQTHVECYTQAEASVCSLEESDYLKIYKILDVKDDLLGDSYGRRQMREVLKICESDPNTTVSPRRLAWIRKILALLN